MDKAALTDVLQIRSQKRNMEEAVANVLLNSNTADVFPDFIRTKKRKRVSPDLSPAVRWFITSVRKIPIKKRKRPVWFISETACATTGFRGQEKDAPAVELPITSVRKIPLSTKTDPVKLLSQTAGATMDFGRKTDRARPVRRPSIDVRPAPARIPEHSA